MKKFLVLIAAAALTIAAAAPALAFELGELGQYIYEGTETAGNEFSTSIGDVLNNLETRTVTVGQAGLDNFGATEWSDLYVGFAGQSTVSYTGSLPYLRTTIRDLWFVTTAPTADVNNVNIGGAVNSTDAVNSLLAGEHLKNDSSSYWNQLEGGQASTMGGYVGFNLNPSDSIINLAALDGGAGSYIDMYLYRYRDANYYTGDPAGTDANGFVDIDGNIVSGSVYVATLRLGLDANGDLYTQINAVPVPGAVWLLGSGLLAVFGIRRRKA